MNKNFRGDTFFRNYSVELENEIYKFQNGDKLKIAFCKYDGEIFLPQEIDLPINETEIQVTFSAEDMAKLSIGDYILEAEFNLIDFVITNQEKIKIDEDYIYGEE